MDNSPSFLQFQFLTKRDLIFGTHSSHRAGSRPTCKFGSGGFARIEVWASMKRFMPKNDRGPPPALDMSIEERVALERSAGSLKQALDRVA
jgi:hypothetical protein